jgi:uncharacterized membrane protein YphA (DoxX/SURF4 family)
MKRIFCIVLSILLGSVFLFSGYSKLFPIEPFQFNFIAIGIANWLTAPILARLIIALEFFLGTLLILNFQLPKFTLKAVISLLLFFTAYLAYQIVMEGNKGNCGCFGEMLKMTPLQSILKNIVLLAIAIFLLVTNHTINWKWKNEIYFITAITAIFITVGLNPFDYNASKIMKDEIANLPLPTDTLYHSKNTIPPSVDLKKGKQIVCFLSLKCRHCLDAAFKMNIIKMQHPQIPFYFIFGGVQENLQPFLEQSKHKNIPYTLYSDMYFFTMCGGQYPGIYYCENGIITKKGNIYTLDADSINKWLIAK